MQPVVTIGEILVEIVAVHPGHGFREPIELIGPFPSGAPAIFIDQVARMGVPAAIIGAVGDDDFGRLNIERLERDGVDVSAIATHRGATTGSAFVRYRDDGARDFVFNIRDSANRHISLDAAARQVIATAEHVHVVGSSLSIRAVSDLVLDVIADMKRRGATVSFDPNVRKEMLEDQFLRKAMEDVLAATDLFLPSGEELALFSSHPDPAHDLRERGVSAVVHKQGKSGARYVDKETDVFQSAFPVIELDPTGAGDIFSATFVAGWKRGLSVADNLRLACAAGALAVTRRGPMEGVADQAELESFLKSMGD